jgi:DNA-directed RNA polymerase specialized sigma24 family protein
MSPDAAAVTALYAEHALGLVRLAVVITGDRGTAEDIVQDAFLGLAAPGRAHPSAAKRNRLVTGPPVGRIADCGRNRDNI